MSLITNLPPNGGVGVLANVVPVAVAQANGAAGTSPTARLLLPTAVVAPSLVPAYSEKPKTVSTLETKPVVRQPSSALAAQLLAQSAGLPPETLEVFAKPANAAPLPGNPTNVPTPNLNAQPASAPVPSLAAQVANIATAKVPANENTAPPAAAPLTKRQSNGARLLQAYHSPAAAMSATLTQRAVQAVG